MSADGLKTKAEPFLKWAGGKRLLLKQILPHIPETTSKQKYFEPFLGGGAIFFATSPSRGVLSDSNDRLIETYLAVRDDVEAVIERLRTFPYSEASYYKIRDSKPRTAAGHAARFIYLNKTCFNGLYRENLEGEFNVPFGRHGSRPLTCDRDQLRRASVALRKVKLTEGDFEDVVSSARSGDVVYFDPPYVVSHTDNGFVEYNARIFSWKDQERLASLARSLAQIGVRVAISNADHSSIRALYSGFRVERVVRWSTMAASKKKRFVTSELLLMDGG